MATQTKSKKLNKTSAQLVLKKHQKGSGSNKQTTSIRPKNLEAIRFLDSLDNATPEEIQEQKETWAFLKKALDEDRLSPNRPLFPDNGDDSS